VEIRWHCNYATVQPVLGGQHTRTKRVFHPKSRTRSLVRCLYTPAVLDHVKVIVLARAQAHCCTIELQGV